MVPMYSMYAKYYDRLNRDYDRWLRFIDEQITGFPASSRMIEYGCGTGNILAAYADRFKVTGVDISPSMLDLAKRKIPEGTFHLEDMVQFASDEKFDVALCLFDSVNHILPFRDWGVFFANVARSLRPGGVFILDANTTKRLAAIEKRPAFFEEFDGNYFYMKLRRRGEKNFIFDVRILRKTAGDAYVEEREEVEETTEAGGAILASLKERFGYVVPYNERKEVISKDSYGDDESFRWFFVCRN